MGVALCRAEFLFGGGEGRKFWSRWSLLGNVNAVHSTESRTQNQ